MTAAEIIALGLALLLMTCVLLSPSAHTRTGAVLLAIGVMAVAALVIHRWSR